MRPSADWRSTTRLAPASRSTVSSGPNAGVPRPEGVTRSPNLPPWPAHARARTWVARRWRSLRVAAKAFADPVDPGGYPVAAGSDVGHDVAGGGCARGMGHPGHGIGVGHADLPLEPSGSRKKMLSTGPKSVTNESAAPRAISRSRMVSKASIEAACRAKWSRRPRPNIGTCRSASVLPSIWNTLSSADWPIRMIDSQTASFAVHLGRVAHHLGVEHLLVEGVESGGVVGQGGDVVEADGQHGGSGIGGRRDAAQRRTPSARPAVPRGGLGDCRR